MAKDRITITLPESLLEQIDAMSAQSGLNRSQQVEKLLAAALVADTAEGFYKSVELRGGGEECMQMVRALVAEDSPSKFDLNREWIIRFLVKFDPGEGVFGGMVMRGAKATASPTMDPREKSPVPTLAELETTVAAHGSKRVKRRSSKK